MAVDDSPSPPDSRIATPDLFASGSDTPWLARKDWASGELRYNAGVKPGLFVGCIGLILLILAFPFAANLPHSIRAYGSYMLIPLLILGCGSSESDCVLKNEHREKNRLISPAPQACLP